MLKTTSPEQMTVRDAAYWLDAEVPGWAHRVDVGTLDITSGACCVLEQVFRCPWAVWERPGTGWLRGCRRLNGVDGLAFLHAFAYPRYQAAWIEAIQMPCDGAWGAGCSTPP